MPAGRSDLEFGPVRASRVERSLAVVRERLRDHESAPVAFVHAGSDADSAYLGVDAIVVTAEQAVGLVERGPDAVSTPAEDDHGRAGSSERRDFEIRSVEAPAGVVTTVLDEVAGESTEARTVLTPQAVRHDVALFLDRAGYDLASTTAIEDARAVKTSVERDAVRALGAATTTGFDTAVERLATADIEDGVLWMRNRDRNREEATNERDVALTSERLARDVAATLAREGVETPSVRVHGVGDGGLSVDRPAVVECRPVAAGVQVRAAWTFVVDGDGGWERRAQLALDAGHRAGRAKLGVALEGEAVTVGEVASEVRAEVTAYGFENPTVEVYGVGEAAQERPRGGERVEPGQVLVVAASVSREEDETASEQRRTDVVSHVETLCLDDGVERVVSLPTSLSPSRVQ